MTKPQVLDGDIVREMTDAEFKQHKLDLATFKANELIIAEKKAARDSALAKLNALGLTEAEVAALLGA